MSRTAVAQSRAFGWGVVGTGQIAGQFAKALHSTPGARFVAVASRDAGRAAARAAELGAEIGTDFAGLLARDDVDVVYIATPNHRHKSECLAAFAAGKAVLCEKPLATTPGDAREIADAARAAGVFCMEAMWTQFIPAIGEVERLIGDGAIGDPRVLIASFGMPVAFDPASRFYDAAQGGGALLDRGCYPVSLALRLLGPVTGVKVERIEAATGVDATTSALLSFAQGRTALISVSLDTLLPNEMSIGGTEGRLVLHEPITRPSSLVIKRAALGAEGSRKGGRRWGGLLRGGWPGHVLRGIARARARHIPVAGNGMNYEIAEVQRCLAEGRRESAVMPLARSIETLDVLAAMAAGRRPDGD